MAFPNTGIYPTPLITFVNSTTNTAGGTSFTFSSTSIGTATPDRVVAIGVYGQGGTTGVTLLSLTLAGITATIAAQNNSGGMLAALALVAYSTGSTANIVASFSTTGVARGGIGVWDVVGYQGQTAVANSIATVNTATTIIAVTRSMPANGAALAFAGAEVGATTTLTWSGATSDFSTQIQANTIFGGAHLNKANRSQLVEATFGTSNTNVLVVLALG